MRAAVYSPFCPICHRWSSFGRGVGTPPPAGRSHPRGGPDPQPAPLLSPVSGGRCGTRRVGNARREADATGSRRDSIQAQRNQEELTRQDTSAAEVQAIRVSSPWPGRTP
jgi:hypothetical protein